MTFKTRFTTAIATGAVLLNALAPLALAADQSFTITGNGSDSENKITVSTNTTTNVTQTNNANVTNNITTRQSTGNNEANKNTGGDVKVNTGAASSNTTVSNTLNINAASVDNCNCNSNTSVTIGGTVNGTGNGDGSENTVNLTNGGKTTINQNNNAQVNNTVNTTQTTGDNEASHNTGGSVNITTGHATSDVTVNTAANANLASVGGGNGKNGGGTTDITIAGNGDDSENKIKLNNDPSTSITQTNDAYVSNNVKSKQETGDNEAEKNVGGDVTIKTGYADSTIGIDNSVNFNAADIDNCGCFGNLNAKIGKNGADSENKISKILGGALDLYQGGKGAGNDATLKNNVDPSSDTGDNESNKNVGAGEGDPVSNFTGGTTSDVSVNNTANGNVFTTDTTEEPKVSFDFDFGSILKFFRA